LTQQEFDYRVVPDQRRPLAHEVYSINRVTATAPDGREAEYAPFFAVRHGVQQSGGPFYHPTRRPAAEAEANRDTASADRLTEVHLSFVALDFNPAAPADWTVHVETTCMNRDLPARLPFGGGQPRLQLSAGGGLVSRLSCLTPPTPTIRTHLR